MVGLLTAKQLSSEDTKSSTAVRGNRSIEVAHHGEELKVRAGPQVDARFVGEPQLQLPELLSEGRRVHPRNRPRLSDCLVRYWDALRVRVVDKVVAVDCQGLGIIIVIIMNNSTNNE